MFYLQWLSDIAGSKNTNRLESTTQQRKNIFFIILLILCPLSELYKIFLLEPLHYDIDDFFLQDLSRID